MGFLPDLRQRGVRALIRTDLRSPSTASWRERLGCYRRGFLSGTLRIYGCERPEDLAGYIPDLACRTHLRWINGPLLDVLNNKYIFGRMIEGVVPTPEMVALVQRGRVETLLDDAVDGFEALLHRHAGTPGLVFRKLLGFKGKGLHIVRFEDGAAHLDGRPMRCAAAAAALARHLGRPPYLVTRYARPAPFSARIFPGASNTIRLISMIDPDTGEPFFPAALYRFGTVRSAPSDNWSAGGLSAGIDVETGTIGRATRLPFDGALQRYDAHPETGARIAGEVVPGWAELHDGMARAARHLRTTPYIGWDVMLTPSGFTVIEGNNNVGLHALQAERSLLSDPRARRFFRHYGLPC